MSFWDSCPPLTPAVIVAYQLVISADGSFRRADWFIGPLLHRTLREYFGEDHRFYLPGSVPIGVGWCYRWPLLRRK